MALAAVSSLTYHNMTKEHVNIAVEWDEKGDATTLKILESLPENWGHIMLNLYQEGASDAEVMKELNITRSKFLQLMGDTITSNFMEVVDHGRTLARAWWERQGRTNLMTRGFQTGLWSWNMQNRYGWSQKSTEHSLTDAEVQNADDDEIDRKLRELQSKV